MERIKPKCAIGRQIQISARINPKVLEYIRNCHQPVNSLINSLLEQWMKKRQDKEILLFQEETGTDEISQLAERHTEHNSQCCNNCIYANNTCCNKNNITIGTQIRPKSKFCCIYWEKKKERK